MKSGAGGPSVAVGFVGGVVCPGLVVPEVSTVPVRIVVDGVVAAVATVDVVASGPVTGDAPLPPESPHAAATRARVPKISVSFRTKGNLLDTRICAYRQPSGTHSVPQLVPKPLS